MPLNWCLETKKWTIPLNLKHFTHKKRALFYVLFGVTLGLFTPARIGEYGGRAYFLPKQIRLEASWSTLASSLAQNYINILFGLIAYILLYAYLDWTWEQKWIPLIIALPFLFFLTISIWKLNYIVTYFNKIKWLQKLTKKWLGQHRNFEYAPYQKTQLFLLSATRYLIYVTQYICILYAFDIGLIFENMLLGIMTLYFLQTILPLTPLLQFSIRGALAIVIFSSFDVPESKLLLSSYLLWTINLLIPAIIGFLFWCFSTWASDRPQNGN